MVAAFSATNTAAAHAVFSVAAHTVSVCSFSATNMTAVHAIFFCSCSPYICELILAQNVIKTLHVNSNHILTSSACEESEL